jgi:hypothetical protein
VTCIRPFAEADIPQVADLHRRVFKLREEDAREPYGEYFRSVFVQNPAGPGPLPSLVCEGDGGRIVGFLGLVPRRVAAGGRRYQALVSSQFIVDPAGPVGLVALRLAKAYLEGPQDLSIADEANDVSRRIWEGLGGTTARLFSIHWTRPLRPARLAMSCLRARRGYAGLAALAGPAARVVDMLAARAPGSHFRQAPPAERAEELCGLAVPEAAELHDAGRLRVEHDPPAFQWLLDRASRMAAGGRLLKAVLRNGRGPAGWYVCHLVPGGTAEVLQVVAAPSSIGPVLDHLIYAAWRGGAVALSGRLEPRFMQALSDRYCLFHRRGPWVLFKTSRPELLQAFQSGDAGFSRLDGEWSLRLPSVPKGRPS